jgi:hypothetical protein
LNSHVIGLIEMDQTAPGLDGLGAPAAFCRVPRLAHRRFSLPPAADLAFSMHIPADFGQLQADLNAEWLLLVKKLTSQ